MGKGSRLRKNPMRHKAFLKLRSLESGGQEKIVLKNGAEVVINPMKHFLLQKEYKNVEMQDQVIRKIGRYALGDEKYDNLEKQAKQKTSAEVKVETN